MGLSRNLPAEEIVAQVHRALAVAKEEGLPPLRNIVFMGMGEPLDNWASVEASLRALVDGRGFGFGPRHVTVSTVGPSPRAIARLIACPTRIAWSLHAADDATRRGLVATQRHPVTDLRDAFAEVFRARRAPLFVELTLIEGVNDAPADAEAAAALLADVPTEVRFNLLPMNPTGRDLRPSPPARVDAFAATLRRAGHFTMVRQARGQDESAACGQLATLPAPARREA
jgi:23S rRNA (adenine2503-C2)-methyltransferase